MSDPLAEVELSEFDKMLGFGPSTPMTPQQELDAIATKLVAKRAEYEDLGGQIKALENALIVRTPEEPGDFTIEGDEQSVTVSRSELWNWDSDIIAMKIPTVPTPEFVKVKYSIDRKEFKKQDEPTQADFLAALTRKPGAARVKVSNKV